MKKPQYNPKYTTCMNMKSAYEQGKSEALKDELIIWQNGFKEGKKLEQAETQKKVEEFFNIHQARFTENQIKYIKIELINKILRSPNKTEVAHTKVIDTEQVQTGSDKLLYLTELKEKIDKKKSEVTE
jgi:hypothetical protein